MNFLLYKLRASHDSRYSKFDWSNGLSTYLDHPELYPQEEHTTLALKLFRREPAITKFD